MFGLNRNVWLNILLAGVNGIADSVWSGTVFVAFLYTLTNNSNSKVNCTCAPTSPLTLLPTPNPPALILSLYPLPHGSHC